MSIPQLGPCPPEFVEIKREIVDSFPDFEARATVAWNEILGELEKITEIIAKEGSEVCILNIRGVN